ncbi:Zn(II)2Cys6 transcription factor [Phanerochaete sordida]|uniref:Zn(II)2Cys6 transcription factor n=1 Tax=Phanerochaete sordida TaxID=48140 RepID=A0A9P3G9C4_9APHY|nr:Zn(II)2Cys6 transcription factor [Phanerochaete sordida]
MSDRENIEREEEDDMTQYFGRKRFRACDRCRKRKVRCDKLDDEATTCSMCAPLGESCTYTDTSEQKKKRFVDDEYVKGLEQEVALLRILVAELQAKLNEQEAISSVGTVSTKTGRPPQNSLSSREEASDDALLEGFRSISLTDTHHSRFLGRSSHFPIMKAVSKIKQEYAEASRRGGNDVLTNRPQRRSQFWLRVFDYRTRDPPYTDFPEPTLMNELIDNYFRTIHFDFPLLHRPSFLQGVVEGRYITDEGFGAVVLLVCALGARFSNNPATLPPDAQSWQVAGWHWFDQVRSMRRLMPLTTTTPADLQVTTLAAAYVASLALQYTNSSVVGHGLRLAQDLGVHRRMTYGKEPTVHSEGRKRAFWCLITMDSAMSAHLGRPCAIHEEDFDLDYPIECDDEYWLADDSRDAFKQPPEKPSAVSHFVWYLKLMRINSRALQTLYSLQGAKNLQVPEAAQEIVAELDSELNQWMDSLPPHLKYESTREDIPFAAQAASLQASYHHLRIFTHRPFITMPRDVPLPFPSLEICTSAARSCIQVLERYFTLSGPALIYQYHISSVFQAGMILLLRIWQKMRVSATADVATEFEHVDKALRILQSLELYWDVAGRSWDMLNDIMSIVKSRHLQLAAGSSRYGADFQQDTPSTVLPSPQHSSNQAPLVCFDALASAVTSGLGPTTDTLSLLHQANSWDTSSAPLAGAQPEYDLAQQNLDAIFAELLPTFGYDESLVMQSDAQPSFEFAQQPREEWVQSAYGPSASVWDSYRAGGSS